MRQAVGVGESDRGEIGASFGAERPPRLSHDQPVCARAAGEQAQLVREHLGGHDDADPDRGHQAEGHHGNGYHEPGPVTHVGEATGGDPGVSCSGA